MVNSDLEPMQHETLKNHWRVAMWIDKGDYSICVAKDYIRTFTDSTLPTYIKMKIPFMKSSYIEPISITALVHVRGMRYNYLDMYICPENQKHLELIGWQYDRDSFMLVLHGKDLDSLRGGTINKGDKIDTRSKSKKQSKENTGRFKMLSFLPSNWRIWTKWSP